MFWQQSVIYETWNVEMAFNYYPTSNSISFRWRSSQRTLNLFHFILKYLPKTNNLLSSSLDWILLNFGNRAIMSEYTPQHHSYRSDTWGHVCNFGSHHRRLRLLLLLLSRSAPVFDSDSGFWRLASCPCLDCCRLPCSRVLVVAYWLLTTTLASDCDVPEEMWQHHNSQLSADGVQRQCIL